ncbi:NAD(P)-binding protein [Auriculariales sp. MPI-PUGE-AT-0066]|nr:NAD(P)-binding protein [Auriculariales sp. MPI-PUGE-AT-0066]
MGSTLSVFFPSKPRWTAANIGDLSGKIYLVTGGNDGIGYETAKELLKHNGKVYIGCRSQPKAEAALARLKTETGRQAYFLSLDLSDLNAVKSSAEQFRTFETKLNVLIANAGVWCSPTEMLTAQGFDQQYGTNVLGHWFLTVQLLPLLRAAVTEGTGAARIVTLSSYGAEIPKEILWDTHVDGPKRRAVSPMNLYAQSKLFNVIQTQEYARRFGADGIIASSINPGNINSSLYRDLPKWQYAIMKTLLLYPVPYGAISQLYAATSPEAGAMQGAHYVPWARSAKICKLGADPANGQRFWDEAVAQTKDI